MTSYTEKQDNSTKVKHSYAYDEYGNLSTENISGQVSRTYGYEYEAKSDRRFKGMTFGGISEELEYDNLDRIISKTVKLNGTVLFTKTYEYYDVKQGTYTNATTLPKSIKYMRGGTALQSVTYGYNTMTGQLNEITVNRQSAKYQYSRNQLFREDNQALNKSHQFYYANDWNMSNKVTGAYNPDGGVNGTYTYYSYSGDKLMTYANQPCVYDAMGNPTTYRGKTATWKGRQMTSFNGVNFTYDGRGRRTGKGSITFLYDPRGRIIKQSNGLEFFYDFEGIAAVKYNSTMYFYQKDAQGNIIGILDSNGNVVVQYYYDAWGNHTVSGSNTTLGNLNPFRYRGYYYDTETGLYYLQTRYYDPEVGRFLNRDAVTYADPATINGLNLYAYCLNNPVMYSDPTGHAPWWDWLLAGIVIIGSAIAAPLTMGTSIYVGGAFAAIAIGGTISVVNQVATTGDLDIDRFTVDVIGSAISGGLAATGLGLAEQIFGNIAIGAGNGLLYSGLSKEPITVESGIDNILSGFIGGVTGWKGAQFLSGKMTMYQLAERNKNITMSLIVALSRSNLSNIIYSIVSNLF